MESVGVPQKQKLKNEAKVEERDDEESEDGSELGEEEDEDQVNLVLEGLLASLLYCYIEQPLSSRLTSSQVDLTIPDHLKV